MKVFEASKINAVMRVASLEMERSIDRETIKDVWNKSYNEVVRLSSMPTWRQYFTFTEDLLNELDI
jgi:hypothetical protein